MCTTSTLDTRTYNPASHRFYGGVLLRKKIGCYTPTAVVTILVSITGYASALLSPSKEILPHVVGFV